MNAQLIVIDSFISHPNYKSSEKYFDIALIKLKSFIRFDEYVRPACVCLPSGLENPWRKAIAIGFGKTSYGLYITSILFLDDIVYMDIILLCSNNNIVSLIFVLLYVSL